MYMICAMFEDPLDGKLDAAGDIGDGWVLCSCNDAPRSVQENGIP